MNLHHKLIIRFEKLVLDIFVEWYWQSNNPILLTVTVQSSSSFGFPLAKVRNIPTNIDGFAELGLPFDGKVMKM